MCGSESVTVPKIEANLSRHGDLYVVGYELVCLATIVQPYSNDGCNGVGCSGSLPAVMTVAIQLAAAVA